MLPHDTDEDEYTGDEDGGEGDLGDGARGEGLYFCFGARGGGVGVPAGEGGEEEEGEEGEDDGDDSEKKWGGHLSARYGMVFGWKEGRKEGRKGETYIKYGKTMLSLKVDATQIKLRGSWSTLTRSASAEAF